MIKVTALALFIALCNAEKETQSNGPSRLLLQVGGFPQQQQQQQQQQPGGYNPYGNMGSILNSPMCQYDPQNCIDMLQNMYQNQAFYGNPYQQPYQPQYYNPYQQPQPVQPPPQVQPPAISQPPVTPSAPAPPAGPVAVPPVTPPAAPGANPTGPVNPPPPPATGVQSGPPMVNGQPLPVVQPPIVGQPGVPGMGAPPMGAPPMGAPPMGAPPMGAPPMGGVPGLIPGMPAMLGPPVTEINCGPPPATMCANRRAGPGGSPLGPLNIGANMANNFKLYCDTPGVCAGSEINMDIRPNPANPQGVRAIEQILCSEMGSCQGTTANIKNLQGNGNNIELSNLECSTGACNGFTLNGWGVSLNDVTCTVPGDCMGCIYNNMKTAPDAFCPDPFAPNAPQNPMCIIESIPCYGY